MSTQIKAARILLGLTQAELCKNAGIPLITLRRVEGKPSHKGLVSDDTVKAIRAALETAGVEFIAENGGGPGARLRKWARRNEICR